MRFGEIEQDEDEMQCLKQVVSRESKGQVASVFRELEKTITGSSPMATRFIAPVESLNAR